MEACFNCYAENGLTGTGIQALADACGLSKASLYTYFDTLDDLIVQSTAYCMSKVEDDFMRLAPTSPQDIQRFIDEVPYWTAKRHGKKYRLMYQVYTHPKYIEHGKAVFCRGDRTLFCVCPADGAASRHPCEVLRLIFIFVRAAVHYALFEDSII
ncbi:MAG: TetR/AcrR family transcriptional regulator [Christensenellales bacterium]